MKSIINRRTTCRCCNSSNIELVFVLNPTPIGDAYITVNKLNIKQDSYPLDLFMCNECGLAQILDIIDPDVLYGEYIYVTGSSYGLAEHFKNYAQGVIKKTALPVNSFVIDIGSNDGTLLQAFKNEKMEVLGIEPAPHIAEFANKHGIRTINDYLSPAGAKEIVEKNGQAKLITSNNVFANIDDIRAWVEAVAILLADDGVYVFESFYLADLIENMVFDFLYHEHVSAFSVKPMKFLFESFGLELIAVERINTKGGSLRYYIQKKGGPMKNDGSVDSLLKEEIAKNLYSKEIFISYQEKIQLLKAQSLEFLKKAKKENKKVVGFGASITCTTLIYHFEIGEYFDYLVDDNPAKQGLYSPGLHLPVHPSKMLYENQPDYVFILAWRFVGPFVKNNQQFIKNGGKFILPVPEFSIIDTLQ